MDLNFFFRFIKIKYQHYNCLFVICRFTLSKSSNKSLKIQSIRQDLQINVREVLKDDTVCFLRVTYVQI